MVSKRPCEREREREIENGQGGREVAAVVRPAGESHGRQAGAGRLTSAVRASIIIISITN